MEQGTAGAGATLHERQARPGRASHGRQCKRRPPPARKTPVERSLAPRSTMVHASLSAQPLKWIMRSSPIIISSIT